MITPATDKLISIPDALMLSLVGFSIVFIALIMLIAVIKVITVFGEKKKKQTDVKLDSGQQENITPVSGYVPGIVPAAGSPGELDLYDTDEYTAALIMAIAADNLKVPLNTLRFKSIRQIEIEEVK